MDAAIASALKKAGKGKRFRLKAEQRAIIKAVVCSKKDVLGVLPTGFRKSLVFHLLSDVFDFGDAEGPPTKTKAITIVVSPLINALMRDQIGKLDYLGAIILDGAKRTNHLATSLATDGKLQLIFSHPELLENNTKAMLKTTNFQRNVRCIVADQSR